MAPQENSCIKNKSEVIKKTRDERISAHNKKCEQIVYYLKYGDYWDSLTKKSAESGLSNEQYFGRNKKIRLYFILSIY